MALINAFKWVKRKSPEMGDGEYRLELDINKRNAKRVCKLLKLPESALPD